MTFTFQSPSGAFFNFDAGQFLTLELPVPEGTVHRTYTISSSPSRPTSLTITVKAQKDSIGTRWMLDHLRSGMKLKAQGPAGQFSVTNQPASKYLFISAGSGITPMMSMTTQFYDAGAEPDIVFVNCATRPSDIIFRERLEHMASRIEGIDLKWVVEESDPLRPWTGYKGRFNQLMLGLMAPDYLERDVYCCGPEPFMQTVYDALLGLGYDMDHYHQESFGAGPVNTEQLPDYITPDESKTSAIEFATSGVTTECNETDTILEVAREAGLGIPTGCSMGICGTCKVQKIDGEVLMVHNGGISEDDIDAGFILACCSKPIGKVVVDI